MLPFMGSQRVGHDLATEQQQQKIQAWSRSVKDALIWELNINLVFPTGGQSTLPCRSPSAIQAVLALQRRVRYARKEGHPVTKEMIILSGQWNPSSNFPLRFNQGI